MHGSADREPITGVNLRIHIALSKRLDAAESRMSTFGGNSASSACATRVPSILLFWIVRFGYVVSNCRRVKKEHQSPRFADTPGLSPNVHLVRAFSFDSRLWRASSIARQHELPGRIAISLLTVLHRIVRRSALNRGVEQRSVERIPCIQR